jgi:PAS domain S-box-containing protein
MLWTADDGWIEMIEDLGLLEAAPDAIVAVDGEGTIVLLNAQAERLFGYGREDLIGKPIELLVPATARHVHPGHRRRYAADLRPRPMGQGMELAGCRCDGSEFPAEISLSAVELDSTRLIVAAIRDVTERREIEADRQRLRDQADQERLERQLQQSQRLESLGQLAGGVAHDFNNLLGAIMNYAQFVAEEVRAAESGDLDRPWAVVRSDVAQIELAAERAAALTRQLLAFARREVVRPQVLDLNAVIRGVEPMLQRTLGEHVELTVRLADELPRTKADPGQLEQVLVNLAVNARDAMPGGGTVSIETDELTVDRSDEPGALAPGRYVRLCVVDTGDGMAAPVVERAFEPFFTTKAEGDGSGLGLATVYGIVSQAGGTVQIRSELGAGTTIVALLPATDEAASPEVVREQPRGGARGETILIVEDEDLMRDATARILRGSGYVVLEAANGPEALEVEAACDAAIHLVLSDVIMPKMLGQEVVDRIRRRRPAIRALYMSGYTGASLGPSGALEPGVELIEKPCSAGVLLDAVRRVLDEPG